MIKETQVVIIGGGATGIGVLRDLSLRGVKAVLFEQGGLAHGTSSRFHGLLHSGGRYAVKDSNAARECIEENTLLRTVARPCIEETEGLFVLTPEDDPQFEQPWVEACARAGIPTKALAPAEALSLEPNLSPRIQKAYAVPDCGVDGFRLIWHNAMSARQHGGEMHTYHKVTGIITSNGAITAVKVCNTITGETHSIQCQFVINATGPWTGEIAHLAGLKVDITPDRGTLIVFNHLFTSRVINRLHSSGDGDIFVPHGSVTILGTTSTPAKNPGDTRPTPDEVLRLLDLGEPVFPLVRQYRILRVFAGNRPLYTPPDSRTGRDISRNFVIVDHEEEGLKGFASIFGGKLTTYRLMAEKICDLACSKLGIAAPCATRTEPLVPPPSPALMKQGKKLFPGLGAELIANRTGADFPAVMDRLIKGEGRELLCECEMVTRAEIEMVSEDPATRHLTDIRLRTRLGMGTCQGTFCSLRAIGILDESSKRKKIRFTPRDNIRSFLRERWRGLRPALWGTQLQEIELGRAIFAGSLNIGKDHE